MYGWIQNQGGVTMTDRGWYRFIRGQVVPIATPPWTRDEPYPETAGGFAPVRVEVGRAAFLVYGVSCNAAHETWLVRADTSFEPSPTTETRWILVQGFP